VTLGLAISGYPLNKPNKSAIYASIRSATWKAGKRMGSDQAKSQAQPAGAEGLYARANSDSQQVEEDPRAPPCAPCAHSPAREIGQGGGLAIGKARSDDPAEKFSRRPMPLVFPALAFLPKTFDPFFVDARNFPTVEERLMPKAAGEKMPPPIVGPSRAPVPTRGIKSFDAPAPGPHHVPVDHGPVRGSNDVASAAVRKASDHSGAIDPRQQHN